MLCFQPGQVLLGSKEGAPRLPLYREVEPLLPPDMEWTALLTVDGQAIFTPDPLREGTVPEGNGLHYGPVRLFRDMDSRFRRRCDRRPSFMAMDAPEPFLRLLRRKDGT